MKDGDILTAKNKYKVMKADFDPNYHCDKCCFESFSEYYCKNVLLKKNHTAHDLCNKKTYFVEVER